MNADDRRAYERGWADAMNEVRAQDGMSEVRAEILDLCDSIDSQLIGYFAIADKLRAIVAEDES